MAKTVDKCEQTMTFFDSLSPWRQFSQVPKHMVSKMANSRDFQKTPAILVHQQFWYTFGWFFGAQKGIKTDGFQNGKFRGRSKVKAIVVHQQFCWYAFGCFQGGALRESCRTSLQASGQKLESGPSSPGRIKASMSVRTSPLDVHDQDDALFLGQVRIKFAHEKGTSIVSLQGWMRATKELRKK